MNYPHRRPRPGSAGARTASPLGAGALQAGALQAGAREAFSPPDTADLDSQAARSQRVRWTALRPAGIFRGSAETADPEPARVHDCRAICRRDNVAGICVPGRSATIGVWAGPFTEKIAAPDSVESPIAAAEDMCGKILFLITRKIRNQLRTL